MSTEQSIAVDPIQSTFIARFDYVMNSLGIKTRAELARHIGVSHQLLHNWEVRGAIGSDSRLLFQDRTGFNFDWVNTGLGPRNAPNSMPSAAPLIVPIATITIEEVANDDLCMVKLFRSNKLQHECSAFCSPIEAHEVAARFLKYELDARKRLNLKASA